MFISSSVSKQSATKDGHSIATFFTPQLGYKESARIAKRALKEGITVREIVIQEGLMSEDQVNAVLHVDNLTKPNIR